MYNTIRKTVYDCTRSKGNGRRDNALSQLINIPTLLNRYLAIIPRTRSSRPRRQCASWELVCDTLVDTGFRC